MYYERGAPPPLGGVVEGARLAAVPAPVVKACQRSGEKAFWWGIRHSEKATRIHKTTTPY